MSFIKEHGIRIFCIGVGIGFIVIPDEILLELLGMATVALHSTLLMGEMHRRRRADLHRLLRCWEGFYELNKDNFKSYPADYGSIPKGLTKLEE